MAEFIKDIKSTADKGRLIYEKSIKEELENKIVKIKKIILDCVDLHAGDSEFGLIVSNDSSSDIKLYEVVDRVKSADSLREKIIRNQEFWKLSNITDDEKFKTKLLSINDDLMGLRLLVSLSCDCERMYELIKKYKGELEGNGIIFKNLENNPQNMENGRKIYKIKGEFEEEYSFELQIKSKVDSAWADIEHMLFYKSYQFSYIQSTNRKVMNKLGNLLDKVDELMIQVRESQNSYEKEKIEMEFNSNLGNRFRDDVIAIIGSPQPLGASMKPLFSMFMTFNDVERNTILSNSVPGRRTTFLEFQKKSGSTIFTNNYDKIKERSLEVPLAEFIYATWMNDLERYSKFGIEEDYCAFFELYAKSVIVNNLEYYANEAQIDEDFYDWAAKSIVNALKSNELIFSGKLFFFLAESNYMLFSYYWASKKAKQDTISAEEIMGDSEYGDTSSAIMKVDTEVVSYLLDGSVELHSKKIFQILSEADISDFMNSTFMKHIDDAYEMVAKTKTGNNMPENKVKLLFDEAKKVKE